MRITGGTARGRIIAGPQGLEARPTASKIRQAFFNILSQKVLGASFLDLCAGSGLMGIEALSRGADALVAVEERSRLTKTIESNLKRLGYEAEVICGDVRKVLPILAPAQFDIIFADPPYQSGLAASILNGVHRFELLAQNGLLAIEHARSMKPTSHVGDLALYDCREYGQNAVSFFCRR